MQKTKGMKWSVCFGLMGSLTLTGVVVANVPPATAAPATYDNATRGAQRTPTPTPGGNLLAIGRQRFDRACGRCHPGGEEDTGPRLIDLNWTEERMVRQIRQGSGRMRAIPPTKLPDSAMPALMTYLRSIHAVR